MHTFGFNNGFSKKKSKNFVCFFILDTEVYSILNFFINMVVRMRMPYISAPKDFFRIFCRMAWQKVY